ncbi:MFS multidrug transporter [Aspergillus arachidicola]|uniref:MFS multidrug transporter n=1 Tax=Aspergillus arachidicola TaxID=656916 RepID=A0A2G7FTD6_9EURO|nr:MFS multidrug transporter [Aspergillus arachidicola]
MESTDYKETNSSATTMTEKEPGREQPDLEQGKTQTAETSRFYPETDLDRGIVGWEGQDDPANPLNFAPGKNGLSWHSSAHLPSYMAADFKETDETIISFTVSIYLLGYVLGPLILAPLSEIYGRRIVLSISNWFFVVWQIGWMGGSACLTLGAGVIADLFEPQQRGKATSIWGVGPLIGPVAGPIAGGFLGEEVGWRWVFWVLLIVGGAMSLGIEILNRETYAPVIIRWKTVKLSKELGRTDLRSAYELKRGQVPTGELLKQSLVRPMLLLVKSPIVLLLSTYMSLVYGLLYLFFTTISSVFTEQYGFSTGLSGLAYLGIGVGFMLGLVFVAGTNDRIMLKLAARNGGKTEPEMRLPLMIIFSCILPISFFWYGWTADKHVHWIVPIIGMAPFGIGMMGVYLPIQTYTIDSYPAYAASANATLTATRSLVGALLPLAGPSMFEALGLGWGNSLLGFLALAFVPIPIVFTKWGKLIREKYPVNFDKGNA